MAGFTPPAWVASDWALVGLGVALMLALLFGVSALAGMVAATAVSGDFGAAACGAAVGSQLAFATFGARTFAGCGSENAVSLAIAFLPLPWALVGGLAVEAARRFAWRRLPDDRPRRVAYVAKLVLAFGVALGIVAGLVARGDPVRRGSGFASSLNGGEVWFYSTVLCWFWGWLILRRDGLRVLPARNAATPRPVRPGSLPGTGGLWRRAGEGAAGFALLAGGMAVAGLLFAVVVADSGHERVGVLLGFPVVGVSFGAALVDGAMGAGLGNVNGHSSLFEFGLPAGPAAGAAPPWLFVALLLAPGIVALTVWRRLARDRPAEEQGALAIGAATAAGFAGAAWLAALVGRIVLLAFASRPVSGWFGYSPDTPTLEGVFPNFFGNGPGAGVFVAARPNPAAVLGLGLFWGLAGGLGAAFFWASKHNARWQIAGPGAPSGDPQAPPPPPGSAWLLPETPPGAGPPPGPPPPAGPPEPPAAEKP